VAASTPMLRAAAPRLASSEISLTCGNELRTSSTVPSSDPLSTTMMGAASGRADSLRSVRRKSLLRLRVATTIEIGGLVGGML
jgi:hypothetical protein